MKYGLTEPPPPVDCNKQFERSIVRSTKVGRVTYSRTSRYGAATALGWVLDAAGRARAALRRVDRDEFTVDEGSLQVEVPSDLAQRAAVASKHRSEALEIGLLLCIKEFSALESIPIETSRQRSIGRE